ncbi:two-component system sensor histidine kinase CreC [Halopseudomonas phragmitis]|uniref:histidine kinase n=1 Tax=Halopseudomonas phragmitis TaxID=1931241 RepID=A0A1V0B3V3_9GAMM|nr:two-component system sensor histidine kinase CreC [Halopseudomonas phragmitis]AQZ94585.1 two-component system sensor histidine kinase CreC [Halopseudomonas phragmitis]
MSLSIRILVAWFVLAGLATLLFLNSILNQLPSSVRQASEEVLVDSANLLAEAAGLHWEQGFAQGTPFAEALQRYQQRPLDAHIWSRQKTRTELIVYLTDSQGRVLLHSDPALVGEDFSSWRDVALTLRGEYGARTSRADPEDEATTFMHVAAPVFNAGELVGVLTLAQPTASLQPFITLAHGYFWKRGGLILLGALLLGAALSIWITRSIRRLVEYVERVRHGERISAPRLGERELDRLARATEAMRAEIDGKAYVEQYVHTLTHEMKSPLSAIRGAAELLQETNVPEQARQRFLSNIDSESQRLQRLVDRLLSLASVEKRQHLEHPERLDLAALAERELESKRPQIERKQLTLHQQQTGDCQLEGEAFLLEQTISNLLDNAIEFSLPGGLILLQLSANEQQVRLTVSNDGPPVPDYALERVFERFYSLPRPDGQRKSTGLGLSFVREVAQLHQGKISLRNRPTGGVEVELELPRHPPVGGRRAQA